MKGVLWLLCAMILLQSCTAEYSDTELAGIAAVHEQYKGNITYSKHFGSEGDYLLVKLTDTEVPLEMDNTLEIAGHNIGLILYDHFTEQERDQYDWIRIEVSSSKGVQNRTVSMGMIRRIWIANAQCIRDLNFMATGNYGAYYNNLKLRLQGQFTPTSFDSLTQAVFNEGGDVLAPVELGIDTFGYRGTIVGSYHFLFKSAIDSTPKLLYHVTYLLTGEDSIIDFSLKVLSKQEPEEEPDNN